MYRLRHQKKCSPIEGGKGEEMMYGVIIPDYMRTGAAHN